MPINWNLFQQMMQAPQQQQPNIVAQAPIPQPPPMPAPNGGNSDGGGDDILSGIGSLLSGLFGGGSGSESKGFTNPGGTSGAAGLGQLLAPQAASSAMHNIPQPQIPTQNPFQSGMQQYINKGVNMDLNPILQSKINNIVSDLRDMGYSPRIVSGRRTQAEQAQKVKSGASTTMNSRHLHGDAVDIVDSRYLWNDKKYGKQIGQYANDLSKVAKKHGLETGINWKKYGPYGDFAHVQIPKNQQPQQQPSTQPLQQQSLNSPQGVIPGYIRIPNNIPKPNTSLPPIPQKSLLASLNPIKSAHAASLDPIPSTQTMGASINQSPLNPTKLPPNIHIKNAIQGAYETYSDNPIMAGIAAAQAIHESGLSGKPSGLAQKGNNYFGIKGSGSAGSIRMRTHEYGKKGKYYINADFAKYNSPAESFAAHKKLMTGGIKSNPRLYHNVLNAKTIDEAANALVKAGYATDPKYAKHLIRTYNKYVKPYLK